MHNTSKKPAAEIRLPSAPGFTWELFVSAVVFLSAFTVSFAAASSILNNRNPRLSLLLTAIALLGLTLKLSPVLANKYRERQRSVIQSAEAIMKKDPRPPVLYLRSFKDDEMIARAIGYYSIEQEMRLALFDIGPFIAMAEPDKEEPLDPGAARMRLSQHAWKHKVSEEMSKAALVIMRIGDSEGFKWEMSEAPKRVNAKRLVLWIPPEDEKLYEAFRLEACEWLHRPLPEYKRRKWPFAPQGGIVYFEPDWTPHLQKFKVAWVRQTFWNPFAAVLKIGLKPVYEQLGIEWSKPSVQPTQLLYLLVLCLLMILGAYFIYLILHNLLGII